MILNTIKLLSESEFSKNVEKLINLNSLLLKLSITFRFFPHLFQY